MGRGLFGSWVTSVGKPRTVPSPDFRLTWAAPSLLRFSVALFLCAEGLDGCTLWAAKVQPMLPPETRAKTVPQHLAAA